MKKSFLQNVLDFMSGNKAIDSNKISPKEAVELQLKYLDSLKSVRNIGNYPPYLEIAKQLFSEKKEVIQAAAYYLVRIAENENKYADTILNILKECRDRNVHTEENKSYLLEQINRLEKIRRV